jgi:hypothetical protein
MNYKITETADSLNGVTEWLENPILIQTKQVDNSGNTVYLRINNNDNFGGYTCKLANEKGRGADLPFPFNTIFFAQSKYNESLDDFINRMMM